MSWVLGLAVAAVAVGALMLGRWWRARRGPGRSPRWAVGAILVAGIAGVTAAAGLPTMWRLAATLFAVALVAVGLGGLAGGHAGRGSAARSAPGRAERTGIARAVGRRAGRAGAARPARGAGSGAARRGGSPPAR